MQNDFESECYSGSALAPKSLISCLKSIRSKTAKCKATNCVLVFVKEKAKLLYHRQDPCSFEAEIRRDFKSYERYGSDVNLNFDIEFSAIPSKDRLKKQHMFS
ncbi:hypothetical protein ACTXT7_010612 [Hymenolepis weldensis]